MNQLIISRKDALAQGLKFYFTGKPCSNGHMCERDVAEWRCLECRKAKAARKYQREAPERSAKKRGRYATDPEYREAWKAAAKRWAEENPEKYRKRQREYQIANRAKLLMDKRVNNSIRRKDPEIVAQERETSQAWKAANPEKVRAYTRNRRAIRNEAEGSHTDKDVIEIWDRQKGICTYCPTDLRVSGYHVDHMTPLSRGGSNWPSNLQCLCPPCNLRKWAKTHEEFLNEIRGR